MPTTECRKCGSENLMIRKNQKDPRATELICADCGAWQKFLGKDEIRYFELRAANVPGLKGR